MKLRVRPKSDYLKNASFSELHRINLEWESEIKLWQDELNFFQRLIDKYIMKMVHESTLAKVQDIVNQIIYYNDTDIDAIMLKIKTHEKHLEQLLEDKFSHDETLFRMEHEDLEEEVTLFMENFKKFKQEIFKVMDELLKEEKLRHLLKR